MKDEQLQQNGFTLVEMTIVIVLVALLIGGLLIPLSAQQDIQKTQDTQKLIASAKDSLLGFAVTHCRLPCPANPALASGSANAGIEYPSAAAGCTTSAEGVLPWATLGLPETDAWGRRLRYRVTDSFAKTASCTPTNQAFTLDSNGDITIVFTSGGATLATQIPAVIISHGVNGFRGTLSTGGQLGASADADEEENANTDSAFVSKTPTPTFDDIVDWISPNILKNRMISANRLP